MDTEYFLSLVGCFLVPLVFSIWWFLMRLGYDKRWFVMPGYYISRNFYFFLPAFIVGLLLGIVGLVLVGSNPFDSGGGMLFLIGFGFWGLGFLFAYFEPDWLSPAWYRWLKRKHGDILPYLEQEANRLGRAAWLRQVRTQKDLEAWVNEVRERYKRQS
ncbi:MAG: hypothetical protein KA314_24485 [Chloroflexi bacterium]|nr:hypothetical protein [Chloroflexota bacterium]MBP8059004.1 hypothetical protein [Chloroflexota bacterium]